MHVPHILLVSFLLSFLPSLCYCAVYSVHLIPPGLFPRLCFQARLLVGAQVLQNHACGTDSCVMFGKLHKFLLLVARKEFQPGVKR